jgi:predicted nucleic acid-binding protein
MAASPKRVLWDACTWIALIQQEKNIIADGIDRYTRCRTVIDLAAKGKIEIVCSALCLAEVCKNKDLRDQDPSHIARFFEHEYLLAIALGREIAETARGLMMAGIPKLKPADACHVASALEVPGVTEMHTFDDDLIAQSGKLQKRDGASLKICYPDAGGPVPPLLKGA